MLFTYLSLITLKIEYHCFITFFYLLTNIAVLVLQNAIAEAVSNIRESL